MIRVRYMTPEEEKEQPGTRGMVKTNISTRRLGPVPRYRQRRNLRIPKPVEVLIKKSGNKKEEAFVFAHEIGHTKHGVPWDIAQEPKEHKTLKARFRQIDRESLRLGVLSLFAELCADYYALTVRPGDRMAIEHAKGVAESYTKDMTPEQIRRIDLVARNRVSYTGKSILDSR